MTIDFIVLGDDTKYTAVGRLTFWGEKVVCVTFEFSDQWQGLYISSECIFGRLNRVSGDSGLSSQSRLSRD